MYLQKLFNWTGVTWFGEMPTDTLFSNFWLGESLAISENSLPTDVHPGTHYPELLAEHLLNGKSAHAFWRDGYHSSNWIMHFKLFCIFLNDIVNLAGSPLFLTFSCSAGWQFNTEITWRTLKVKCLLCIAYVLHHPIPITLSKWGEDLPMW